MGHDALVGPVTAIGAGSWFVGRHVSGSNPDQRNDHELYSETSGFGDHAECCGTLDAQCYYKFHAANDGTDSNADRVDEVAT